MANGSWTAEHVRQLFLAWAPPLTQPTNHPKPPVQASMANSSWTAEHVRQLFLAWAPPVRVYPPCDTADLAALPLERKLKRLYLVSLAQAIVGQ